MYVYVECKLELNCGRCNTSLIYGLCEVFIIVVVHTTMLMCCLLYILYIAYILVTT